MGLDLVELAMAVEERFGIDLPDAEAAKLTTPRKLIDYVCSQVEMATAGACASQRSFYRARRILALATKVEKRAIRPATHLEALVPLPDRKRTWPGLAREIGVRRPLARPVWISRSAWGLCGLAFLVTAVEVKEFRLVSAALVAALLGVVLAVVTRPAAVRLDLTVGSLAREAIPAMVAADSVEGQALRWTRDAVAETCRMLIREHLGLTEFSDDADFIRDLGAG